MAEAQVRRPRRRPPRSAGDDVIVEEVSEERPLCSFGFCPICMALTAIGEAKPDLVDHLLSASREMLLAFRALVDARLEGTAPGPPPRKLERLTID
jgi:hypothetical protein